MKYIDFHTHAFADSIAERAMSQLKESSGDYTPCTDGTLSDTYRAMKESGIDSIVLMPIATKPSQQRNINDWSKSVIGGSVYSYGTVHPDAEDVLEELERVKSMGLLGIKLHSEYQFFHPDDDKMFPIYKKCASLGLPVMFHGGWDPVSPDYTRGTPERFARAAALVPDMIFIIAHGGGMNMWDDVEKYLAGKFRNVYFDISVIAGEINAAQLERIIRTHGADRVLFGSDLPWDNPFNEIEMIEHTGLSNEEKEMIFYKNAEKLLGL